MPYSASLSRIAWLTYWAAAVAVDDGACLRPARETTPSSAHRSRCRLGPRSGPDHFIEVVDSLGGDVDAWPAVQGLSRERITNVDQ